MRAGYTYGERRRCTLGQDHRFAERFVGRDYGYIVYELMKDQLVKD